MKEVLEGRREKRWKLRKNKERKDGRNEEKKRKGRYEENKTERKKIDMREVF